jgi:ATP-binding cassette, subfamily B, multidrug efflux pump
MRPMTGPTTASSGLASRDPRTATPAARLPPTPPTLARLIGGFIVRHARAYAASALMLVGIAALIVWVPRQVGRMVDSLVDGSATTDRLTSQILLLLAAGVVIYLLRVGWRLVLFATAYRLGAELRVDLYRRLAQQSPRFYQRHRTGDLMALATNDVDAIEMAAGEALLAAFDGTLTLVIVIATMALGVDARLAAVALLPFPLMALAFWWISRHVHDAAHDALNRFAALNDHVQETISGVRTLRSLGITDLSAQRFGQLAADAAASSLREQRWQAAYEPAVGFTLVTAIVGSLALGGALVWQGEMTLGTLTSFGMYLGQLIWPMFAAGWVLSLIERGRAAWARLAPVLTEPPAVDDTGTEDRVPQGRLQWRNVRFAYPEQVEPALDHVSIALAPGCTLGIVGPTGSGKSTLLKLLLRQWPPDAGDVALDGQPLAQWRLDRLHRSIAWVPQEAFLFSASVAENIALARPDADRTQIEQAAKMAAVHDDIQRLPAGYDTPVGERGVTLSGGQRQRLAIARALLTDAPVLLLDDALSAVDTQTETRILDHLRQARRMRAVVVVSHRLSAVADAGEIAVLRHGRVMEQGTHDELLTRDGWYATQWRYQQLQASLEDD